MYYTILRYVTLRYVLPYCHSIIYFYNTCQTFIVPPYVVVVVVIIAVGCCNCSLNFKVIGTCKTTFNFKTVLNVKNQNKTKKKKKK